MTTEIPYIHDHTERAAGELIHLLDQPNIRALVQCFAEEVQELEDAEWTTVSERTLDRSVGAQLDQYGAVLGEVREGMVDKEYRRFIRIRIQVNRSTGSTREVLIILRDASEGEILDYHIVPPAAFIAGFVVDEPLSETARNRVYDRVLEASPAGVGIPYLSEAQPGYFGFADDDNALGFGEGTWASAIDGS